MTSMPDGNIYITSNIRKFQEVETLADYTRIVSRINKSTIDRSDKVHRPGLHLWLNSWPRSDKLALANLSAQAIAVIVGILALLIAAGLLIF